LALLGVAGYRQMDREVPPALDPRHPVVNADTGNKEVSALNMSELEGRNDAVNRSDK